MRILYLYGFASGPQSDKAQFFKNKFSSVDVRFDIYDYIPDIKSFTNLKTSHLLEKLHSYIQKHYPKKDLILFGSSFGGLLSTWYASKHPEKIKKLILMAPALKFSSLISTILDPVIWKEQGHLPVFHYRHNKEIPLAYSFYEDISANTPPNFEKTNISIPTLILHGKSDEVVPISWSQKFAAFNQNATFHPLNGDHQLLDQKETMWNLVKEFLKI